MKSILFLGIVTLVVSILMASCPVRAQVNIEKLRDEPPEGELEGNFALLFSSRSGNVDITQFSGNLRMDYASKSWKSFLIVRGVYGWLSGEPFSNEGLVHLRYVYRARGWIHPETYGQIDYDEARKLDFRSLFGAGFRFNLVERENLKLSWGTGYMYEYERFNLAPEDLHSEERDQPPMVQLSLAQDPSFRDVCDRVDGLRPAAFRRFPGFKDIERGGC